MSGPPLVLVLNGLCESLVVMSSHANLALFFSSSFLNMFYTLDNVHDKCEWLYQFWMGFDLTFSCVFNFWLMKTILYSQPEPAPTVIWCNTLKTLEKNVQNIFSCSLLCLLLWSSWTWARLPMVPTALWMHVDITLIVLHFMWRGAMGSIKSSVVSD